jgi:SAM-dependent methyltransferase
VSPGGAPYAPAVPGGRAFDGSAGSAARWLSELPWWWEAHYGDAADRVISFCADDGVALAGRRVLDLGCGDGIISLGLAHRSGAAEVLGVDLQPTDEAHLADMATAHGVEPTAPNLRFAVSGPEEIPVPDGSVDTVTAWSVLEHVPDFPGLLSEVHRILVPDGIFFVQIWPLFSSAHGSHLFPWIDEPFHHLRDGDEAVRARIRGVVEPPELAESVVDLYDSCNRVTLDELGAQLVRAGFFVAKVAPEADAIHVPAALQDASLSDLVVAGVTLLAVRQ